MSRRPSARVVECEWVSAIRIAREIKRCAAAKKWDTRWTSFRVLTLTLQLLFEKDVTIKQVES